MAIFFITTRGYLKNRLNIGIRAAYFVSPICMSTLIRLGNLTLHLSEMFIQDWKAIQSLYLIELSLPHENRNFQNCHQKKNRHGTNSFCNNGNEHQTLSQLYSTNLTLMKNSILQLKNLSNCTARWAKQKKLIFKRQRQEIAYTKAQELKHWGQRLD